MTTPSAPEPAAGCFDGRAFIFPLRVYYEDTDFSGVVYHASYLRFMERGRSEFLRAAGAPHQAMLGGDRRYFGPYAVWRSISPSRPGWTRR